ncbi:hypothetical protein [Acinetobacter baumannii]|uniref:hypothetical protein n=1 Tax=Acinetobacter baumannii TaxID=470 RepID=UPI001116AB56|nr:hypothetical protein [Acinetobacter baumannii]
MDSFTLTLYVSSLLLLQSLSFLFKDEVEEFDTSLICLSLMCAVGIKASFIFFTTTLSINKIVSIIRPLAKVVIASSSDLPVQRLS